MVGLLTEVLLRGFRLGMIVFRNTECSSSTYGTRYTSSSRWTTKMRWLAYRSGVRVFQDVERVAALDVEDDVLEPDAAIGLELRVLRVVPVEVLHLDQRKHNVCSIGTHRHRL
jgi:hypothetical protein